MEKMFFNEIASFYDDMIGFDAALERRTAVLQKYISPDMKYAADIGCGTGLDSLSLSRNGLSVRAFDNSDGMLEQAKTNAEKYGIKIKFYNSSFPAIPAIYDSSFDLAVSLGNTIANINRDQINTSLNRLYNILKPGGRSVIQILNFERLKKKNDRIVNITIKENVYYIRFYDFLDGVINFNILRFNADNMKERKLETTTLYPYSSDELAEYFSKNAFSKIEIFGSLDKDNFDKDNSPDIVISAFR